MRECALATPVKLNFGHAHHRGDRNAGLLFDVAPRDGRTAYLNHRDSYLECAGRDCCALATSCDPITIATGRGTTVWRMARGEAFRDAVSGCARTSFRVRIRANGRSDGTSRRLTLRAANRARIVRMGLELLGVEQAF